MDLVSVSVEIQPKDLQEEAEERRLSKTQLSVLLLRCRQQRPITLRLGEFTLLFVLRWIENGKTYTLSQYQCLVCPQR